MISRRFLPPLSWLAAFETVVRTGSVTDAAAELDLTQGAVSRQIQKLEENLETRLFQREKRRLVATPAGRAYAAEIQTAISGIVNATLSVRSNPDGGLLNLAILPAFGTHWLAPHLPDFLKEHPGVSLNLATRTQPFDFNGERFHAAVHFGSDDWSGTRSLKLMDEEILPVYSPELFGHTEAEPGDLLGLPLLHLETRSDAWHLWFAHQGIAFEPGPGIAFDQFATMLKAAKFGAGAALMPKYLVEDDIAEGKLAILKNAKSPDVGAYFLVWPEALSDYPPVIAFRDWIGPRLPGKNG